ncbi:unnamed protein product [Chondrus crispus]|uniref:Mediator of RNA polymerase II transcription subunit 1 n=1 Tax=Chondrus crispus TaxID=2769 RepID=R7QD12_CHOCR|nr:unnamed protein product [Chondrus crispus]CDF35340.1 unnamed protein product [Chondrus crispus]|eukprot:XP_005715159.1 unnamed protein product [Chondrus crispus]
MMPSTDEAAGTTARDAIFDIHRALHSLASSSGLSRLPSPQPRYLRQASLHPLSRRPLAAVRRELALSLVALKGAAAARESWESPNPDRLLHVKRDTILKTRVIQASKAALAECRRLAATQDPFATKDELAIHSLRAVAVAANAITSEEVPDPASATAKPVAKRILTVCGAKFLADFHFFDAPNDHVNVKAKFRHLTADDAELPDSDIDADFVNLIRNADYDAIKFAFHNLIAKETLSARVSQHISLIDALRGFEDDLISAHHAEVNAPVPSTPNTLDADPARRGHGIVKRSARGLRITFMKGRHALLGVEDGIANRSIAITRTHPTLTSNGRFHFDQPKMATLAAQYVLTFENPVFVCLSVAQTVERLAGVPPPQPPATATGGSSGRPLHDRNHRTDGRPEEASDKNTCLPSLQELLAPAVFGERDGLNDEEMSNPKKEGPTPAREVVKKKTHWSQPSTEFIAAAALPNKQYIEFSHSGSNTVPGLAICRIPLCHPKDVLPVLGLIRQQIVFNELFRSCFGSPLYTNPTLKPFQPQPVEVVLCDAPSFMQFNLYDSVVQEILSMAVTIELGGDISVSLQSSSDKTDACSDAKATAILAVSRSIPLAILTILKILRG